MKCPFCTESIHPNAKFCPKCGLPLKDDATVMGGAYVSDDSSMSPAMIAAGAGGLVVVALLIGWLTGQTGKKPQDQVRREPLRTSPAVGMSGLRTPGLPSVGGYPSYASMPMMQTFRGGPAADYRPNVRWAWNPPALPPVTGNPATVQDWEYAPMAPTTMGTLNGMIQRENRQRPPQLLAAAPTVVATPAIPDWLAGAAQNVAWVDPTAAANAAVRSDVEGGPFAREAPVEDPRSAYVYDPVQEQWVVNPDRVSGRRLRAMTGGAPARSGRGNGAGGNVMDARPGAAPATSGIQ